MTFEVALFEPLGTPIRMIPAFFILVTVLSVSGTRTRRSRIEHEYEYHFIEYEYGRSQKIATQKE
jgi:hypothetical protein